MDRPILPPAFDDDFDDSIQQLGAALEKFVRLVQLAQYYRSKGHLRFCKPEDGPAVSEKSKRPRKSPSA